MNKRSQSATEYLIILAVVIIIALIVVGVMGGIPRPLSNMKKAEIKCNEMGFDYSSKYEPPNTHFIRCKNYNNNLTIDLLVTNNEWLNITKE